MKNLVKMNNAIKQLSNVNSPEEYNEIKQKIFKYRNKIMQDVQKQKLKANRKKQEMQRQALARQTSMKGELKILKQKKFIMQQSLIKKQVKWPNITIKK